MADMKPLSGVRVIEIGHSVAGPYAGMILGELGAEVIKIEPPGGDSARGWGPPFVGDSSAVFAAVNRSKRSVVCDLARPAERDRLLALIRDSADVVLHNLKPGALERLGLGPEALFAARPRLILCNMGAYGASGPLRDRPGYDPMVQAATGLMSILGEAGRPPVRVPLSFIDMSTGMWSAIGILAALRSRDATGSGCVVDTSLYEAGLAWMAVPILSYLASAQLPERLGSGLPTIVPSQAFEASDGWIMVSAGNESQFARLADAIGRPGLASDPRFATNAARVRNREAVAEAIAAAIRPETRAHWVARLDAARVPASTILTIDEVAAHAQTAALGMLQAAEAGAVPLMGLPLSFDGVRPALERPAPALGADGALLATP